MSDCIFCRVVRREIPSKIVYEDDQLLAFEDVNPQAPVHLLVIPKKHIDQLSSLSSKDQGLGGALLQAANRLAKDKGILEEGFRVVINSGPKAGQTVFHLHLHVMGGRLFRWPPG